MNVAPRSLKPRTRTLLLCALAAFLISGRCPKSLASATAASQKDDTRDRAYELYDQNKFKEAIPLLERLLAENSKDIPVLERLAVALVAFSNNEPDGAKARQMRIRARQLILQARDLGDESNLSKVLISQLPPDGSAPTEAFSNDPAANTAMVEGEKAFSRGDFPTAIENYRKALDADPKLYKAALFLGDVYFTVKQPVLAGEWYQRAITIEPNRETAYRYWADALVKAGQLAEARTKLIDAVIAEPYSEGPWRGVGQWAKSANVELMRPMLPIPDYKGGPDGHSNITIDSSAIVNKDGSIAWIAYIAGRNSWESKKFKETYPAEKQYRHSLLEEADALKAVVKLVESQVKDGSIKTMSPGLKTLMKLSDAGLIESYVLISRADRGIGQDYDAYRSAHRDKLRQYLSEYIFPEVK